MRLTSLSSCGLPSVINKPKICFFTNPHTNNKYTLSVKDYPNVIFPGEWSICRISSFLPPTHFLTLPSILLIFLFTMNKCDWSLHTHTRMWVCLSSRYHAFWPLHWPLAPNAFLLLWISASLLFLFHWLNPPAATSFFCIIIHSDLLQLQPRVRYFCVPQDVFAKFFWKCWECQLQMLSFNNF